MTEDPYPLRPLREAIELLEEKGLLGRTRSIEVYGSTIVLDPEPTRAVPFSSDADLSNTDPAPEDLMYASSEGID